MGWFFYDSLNEKKDNNKPTLNKNHLIILEIILLK